MDSQTVFPTMGNIHHLIVSIYNNLITFLFEVTCIHMRNLGDNIIPARFQILLMRPRAMFLRIENHSELLLVLFRLPL